MIDFNKPVKTRDGRPVRILNTCRVGGGYPVVGIITNSMGEELLWLWTTEGKSNVCEDNPHHYDLVQYDPNALDVTKPVQTRSGLPARIVDTDFKDRSRKLRLAVVYTDTRGYDHFAIRDNNGTCPYHADSDCDLDIVNIPKG